MFQNALLILIILFGVLTIDCLITYKKTEKNRREFEKLIKKGVRNVQ